MITKSTFTALVLSLIFNTFYSQETILDIPINKKNSILDVSNYDNAINYYYGPFEERYSKGINNEDSSALKLGLRKFIEITPNNIPTNSSNKDIELSIDLKFGNDVDEQFEFPTSGSTLIIGAVDENDYFSMSNLQWGFIFNYIDSTITDNFGITNIKVENINEWNTFTFNFNNSDSTINVSLNNSIISSQSIDSSISLSNESKFGIGQFLNEYLHTHIDNIKIVLKDFNDDSVITSSINITETIQEKVYYNLLGNKLDENQLRKGQVYIEKTLYKNGNTTTVKFLK
jgi:hypothetical protein